MFHTLPRFVSVVVVTFQLLLVSFVRGDEFSSSNSQANSDFGVVPAASVVDTANQLARQPGQSSYRSRLIREKVLDEESFSTRTSPNSQVKNGKPPLPDPSNEIIQTKTNRISVEDVPPLPESFRSEKSRKPSSVTTPSLSIPIPNDATEDQSDDDERHHPVASPREKIERRYSDPRTARLLEQMTAQSAQSLFIEVAQLVDSRHIQPTPYARRIDDALQHLLMCLETSAFHKTTRLQPKDGRSVDRLQSMLVEMRRTIRVRDLSDAVSVLDRVASMFEELVNVLPGAVGLEFVHAQLDTLDQFSMLIPPEKSGGPSVGLRDSVVGIGVEVEKDDQGLKVLKVLQGGPAADVAMKRGDIVTAIDGNSLKGLEVNQAVDYILGDAGTPLRLNLVRKGRRGEVTLVRRKIDLRVVTSQMLDTKNQVGYIRLEQFNESCVRELDEALAQLHEQGMESLVLDLRG
ncbi:MAG: PDZ domain-containing protein, partial [Planctomycetes bacterium]|nr:PDZ domain-containing protein [Planctomycetota bacterium]